MEQTDEVRHDPAGDGESGHGWKLALGAIAVVVAGAGLSLARDVLVPIAIALLLYALLRPLVRRMERWKIPPAVSACLVVIGLLGLLFGIGAAFSQPLQEWAHRAPKTIEKARAKFATISARVPFLSGAPASGGAQGGASNQPQKPAQRQDSASKRGSDSSQAHGAGGRSDAQGEPNPQAGSAAGDGPTQSASPAPSPTGGGESPKSGGGSGGGGSARFGAILGGVFGTTASLLTGGLETLLLLAFLLAAGDSLRKKVRSAITGQGDRDRAVRIAEDIEAVVSRYVVATALINVGQGVAVGLAMWALGLPTPALWALMTVVVEFVPYLGALVMVVLLAVAGLATFGSFGHAMLAPAAYLGISTLQNNLVSPVAYGRRLKLSPAVILVSVMVWWFLWGVAGAFVAVPVVAALKVLTEHVPSLKRFSELLSD